MAEIYSYDLREGEKERGRDQLLEMIQWECTSLFKGARGEGERERVSWKRESSDSNGRHLFTPHIIH